MANRGREVWHGLSRQTESVESRVGLTVRESLLPGGLPSRILHCV